MFCILIVYLFPFYLCTLRELIKLVTDDELGRVQYWDVCSPAWHQPLGQKVHPMHGETNFT